MHEPPVTARKPEADRDYPRVLLLQWHITERCNLRCSHCYQEHYSAQPELGFDKLLAILEQYLGLLDAWAQLGAEQPRGFINITGGEPLARRDFFDLLEVFSALRDRISFGVLSNGTLIDKTTAERLRELGAKNVQVSLDGRPEVHDQIRGAGKFDEAIAGLRHLTAAGVPTVVSFTAHRANFRDFYEVARICRDLGVSRVWADRLIPTGTGQAMAGLHMGPDATQQFFEVMSRARADFDNSDETGGTEIWLGRALQFLVGGGTPYQCGAGSRLITVDVNGDLFPCRRLPVKVGNLLETPLHELYYKSDVFLALRGRDRLPPTCRGCAHSEACRGGLRCLSYAVNNDPFMADPGCWVQASTITENETTGESGTRSSVSHRARVRWSG